jgi:hypothetical protein
LRRRGFRLRLLLRESGWDHSQRERRGQHDRLPELAPDPLRSATHPAHSRKLDRAVMPA